MGVTRAGIAAAFGSVAMIGTVIAVPGAEASEPASGAVSAESSTVEWTGAFAVPGIVTPTACEAPFCDTFALTVDLGTVPGELSVTVEQSGELSTPTVRIVDAEGEVVTEDIGANPITVDAPVTSGEYTIEVITGSVEPATTYTGTASLTVGQGPVDPSTGTVLYDFDEEAPVASVEVPLRVVMVGFEEDSVEAEQIFSEVPDNQRVGSLYKYDVGFAGGGGDNLLFGNDTLINHGRAYYTEDQEPFLLPIEYRWTPELHYAPASFTRGLFESMMATSTTGDYANPALRAYLDAYNASRGSLYRVAASGDPAQAVAPGAPVRYIDGEDAEDWINAHAEEELGFPAGRDPGQPGYTVFVLNTWDSPEAQEVFPAGEYHVFRIERTDPDRGDFDGIDWARVWGGRYRFMMVDLGAAPNAYESETWGNRGRSVNGSALFDPPLWEYRAGAPKPVEAIHLVDGSNSPDAITPGEFWDDAALQEVLARTVNEAANFRFFHSYLYEPRPGTGRFFLSDNVWHDTTTLYPSDLELLYDQETALNGLRTLTPYFDFSGDVVYEYLEQSGEHPEYAEDQAALDAAKQSGGNLATDDGVGPYTAMDTHVMMDYLDSLPDRFLRGGECATTVPTIQVVVPGHLAWAAAIVAGIAENRNGVPWGFLNSVNDVTKWNGADRDQAVVAAHPNALYNGTFTYTTIHEASHYLGLAHPHDTVGAVRGENGEPVYYDGFTWTFNTTAAPTTYSHVETTYSILDQESIARGHSSYYLQWTGEALEEAGGAWVDQGITSVDALGDAAALLRLVATWKMVEAQERFADFRFVDAAFSAQSAWRAAAEYRDLALGLPAGTSQVERGTQLGTDAEVAAAGCPSASRSMEPTTPYDPGPAARAGTAGAGSHIDLPGTPPHTHGPNGGVIVGPAVEVAGRPLSSGHPVGGPPLAAAALAAGMIVVLLRLLARRSWV